MGETMKHRLSNRLSPGAKKRFLAGAPEEPVRCLLQVAPAADAPALRRGVEALGGTVQSWMTETRLLGVQVPAGTLAALADLPGVAYVDAETPYRQ